MARQAAPLALAGVPRVDLMPRIERESRARVVLTRRWAVLIGAAAVVTVLVIAGAFGLRVAAEAQLAAEQARTTALLTEIAEYSAVSTAISDAQTLDALRAGARVNDFAWGPLVATITGVLPEGVTLASVVLTPGAPPVGDDPTVEVGARGDLTFTTKNLADQAATVAALLGAEGVLSADAGSLTLSGDTDYTFTATIAFDQSIYTGDPAQDGGN
ncbi:hypothetical protein GCM10009775_26370 [Microbacterium aoyamense]|uniref:Fimbrial assembly protein (PilN) n=1 Tax=Microbacterium aoyamense TaxID=344166 RepID=A0ABN2PVA7_9MICO|nr:hypothetical protein [Microbacterium aoyamense]